jgi:hypothetical protein
VLIAFLTVFGTALVVGCGLASVILFAKATELKEASAKRQLSPPEESREPPTLSITDRTTNLLPVNKSGDLQN